MEDAKFLKWLDSHISNLERDLINKSRSADLLELRYLSGQVHESLVLKSMYLQLRREGDSAEG